MPIRKRNNAKTTLAFPPEHVMVQSRAPENDDVGGIDFDFDSQVRETNPRPFEWPHCTDAIISQVIRQLVFVWLRRQLVGVNSDIDPVRRVDAHKH